MWIMWCTSPFASNTGLPCSWLSSRAISFWFCLRSSVPLNSSSARSSAGVSAHCFSTALAAATAAFTSSTLARGTLPTTLPLAGFFTS